MKIFKNPELKGILGIVLAILVVATITMAMDGRLEQWFGITLFSGPRALDKIVFVREKDGVADLYSMNTDGSRQRSLTQDANPDSQPAISMTGNKILFVANKGDVCQVYAVGGRGGSPTQVTTATGTKSYPLYSPSGKTMSFIASGKVYVADLSGQNLDPVLPTHEETRIAMTSSLDRGSLPFFTNYAWGPGGTSMAGVAKDANGSDMLVYLPELEGKPAKIPFEAFITVPPMNGRPAGIPTSLVDQRGKILHISWSAQKPILAVSSVVGKTGVLGILDVEGGKVAPIIIQKEVQFSKPVVSVDGSFIIVGAKGPKKSSLIRIDLSSGRPTALVEGEYENPSLSPDGEKLLATQITAGGKRDIVVIDLTNGKLTKLTTDGHSYDAIWTPASVPLEGSEDHDHEHEGH